MKPLPSPTSATKRPPRPRPQAPTTTRSRVLLSLIVCPRGGVDVHRHGQGRG
jgi:hypothetical protein